MGFGPLALHAPDLAGALDPALALRAALAPGDVAGPCRGASRGRDLGRRGRRALAGFPRARGPDHGFGEAAADAGDVDVVEAVVGADQGALGGEEDVVARGLREGLRGR